MAEGDEYEVVLSPAAQRDLRKLNKAIAGQQYRRIDRKIGALADEPRPEGCEKLTSREEYRIRDGDFRILYEIDDGSRLVLIGRVRHRREVYGK